MHFFSRLKKHFTYLILAVYVFAQLKPVSIVVSDLLAHVFDESRHMATVHFENGHYHLHYELGEASKENDTMKGEKKSSFEKAPENSPQHVSDFSFNIYLISSAVSSNGIYHDWVVTGFSERETPPPRIL